MKTEKVMCFDCYYVYTVNPDKETCTINTILNQDETVYIPTVIDGYLVTKLGNDENTSIFAENTEISVRKVVIPDSVVMLNKYCFYNCNTIETFIMSEKLQYIGSSCFMNCTKLKEIVLPKTIINIEGDAFNNCFNLENLTIFSLECEILDIGLMDKSLQNVIYLFSDAILTKHLTNYNILESEDLEIECIRKLSKSKEVTKRNFRIFVHWSNNLITEINDYNYEYTIENDVISGKIYFRNIQPSCKR